MGQTKIRNEQIEDTITGKTIDGDDNTLQDIASSSLKTSGETFRGYANTEQSNITDGIYSIKGSVRMAGISADDRAWLYVYNTSTGIAYVTNDSVGATNFLITEIATEDKFTAGDTIYLTAKVTGSTGAVDIATGSKDTWMTVRLVETT